MKSLIILLFVIVDYATSHCLVQNSVKCAIEENLADPVWLHEICQKTQKESLESVSIVGVVQNDFKTYRTLENYCEHGTIGRLSWINYTKIIEPILNSRRVKVNIPRVTRAIIDGQPELLLKRDHATDHELQLEVLVEHLPLRYELRNIQRTAWENVTRQEKEILAEAYLRNDDEKSKILTQNPLIVTNHSIFHIFPSNIAEGSEMRLYENDQINRIVVGHPRDLHQIRETMRISKRMAAKSHTSVRVEGIPAKIWYEITGDLTLVYSDFKEERKLLKAQVIESKMIDIRQVGSSISRIGVSYDDALNGVEDPEARYRTFNILAICASVLFFGTMLVVFTDVVLKLLRMRKEKKIAHKKIGNHLEMI
ncbi:uncharacterized protein LOC134834185 [Culicoides brevitarsis]|uniref:uncharacterized protein LOC134834185 n=1 Tax=Culicoides brevitarsis TaxID=469753 RepID=UPI00307C72C7